MKKHLIIPVLGLLAFASVASAQSYTFGTDLYVGSQGSDVANLQTFLIANGFTIPAVTSGATAKGYFGVQTQQALSAYQRSVGITSNGYFGPITRAWLNSHQSAPYVQVLNSPQPAYPSYPPQPTPQPTYPNYGASAPIIGGVDAPTTLGVGQTGTWTIRASDTQNSVLSYSVDWGDASSCPSGYVCTTQPGTPSTQFVQQTTFTHAYSAPGTYTVKFTVRNSGGLTAQINSSIQIIGQIQNNNNAGPLRIISPNGGEVWQRGSVQNITWTAPYYFVATNADIKITQTYNCTTQICPMIAYAPYTIATGVSINQNSYSWTVGSARSYSGTLQNIPDGQYTVQICQSGGSTCDSSDTTFTVTTGNTVGNQQITVLSPNGGEVWQANTIHPITWSQINGTYSNNSVDIYLGNTIIPPCIAIYPTPAACSGTFQASYTLDKNVAGNANYSWIVGTDINNHPIPAGTYILEICPAGYTVNCDQSNSPFTFTGTAYSAVYNQSTGQYQPGINMSSYTSYGCPAGYTCTPVTNPASQYTY